MRKELVAAHEFDLPYRPSPEVYLTKGGDLIEKLVVTRLSNRSTSTDDVDRSVEAVLWAVRLMG